MCTCSLYAFSGQNHPTIHLSLGPAVENVESRPIFYSLIGSTLYHREKRAAILLAITPGRCHHLADLPTRQQGVALFVTRYLLEARISGVGASPLRRFGDYTSK